MVKYICKLKEGEHWGNKCFAEHLIKQRICVKAFCQPHSTYLTIGFLLFFTVFIKCGKPKCAAYLYAAISDLSFLQKIYAPFCCPFLVAQLLSARISLFISHTFSISSIYLKFRKYRFYQPFIGKLNTCK